MSSTSSFIRKTLSDSSTKSLSPIAPIPNISAPLALTSCKLVYLEMCGIEIYGENNVNVGKWKRFAKRDICEIMIKDKYWDYIDLSALND